MPLLNRMLWFDGRNLTAYETLVLFLQTSGAGTLGMQVNSTASSESSLFAAAGTGAARSHRVDLYRFKQTRDSAVHFVASSVSRGNGIGVFGVGPDLGRRRRNYF